MLVIKDVSKTYDNGKGIKDFNITLEDGNVFCIIGPNGVGKSTFLKIVAGVMKNDEGICKIDDIETYLVEAKKYIGYLPEKIFTYNHLSVYELLKFVASMKEIKKPLEEIEMLLKKYDLIERKDEIINNLSLGMKKKLGICIAFLGNPRLLVLDEPTNGLDTKGVITLKEEIKQAREQGNVIVVSSHILDFVSQVGDCFCFIKSGKIVRELKSNDINKLEVTYKELFID